MKIEIVTMKIKGFNNPQKIMTRESFKHYFEILGYSRKRLFKEHGVSPKIFNQSLRVYYTHDEIEKLRVKKITYSNIEGRMSKWKNGFKYMEKFIPEIETLFKENIQNNPEIIMHEIIKVNTDFYKFKQALRPVKKYINQAIKRLGRPKIKLVGNGLEAKVKNILDDLNIIHECQFHLDKYYYDFRVGKTLIETDGRIFHDNIVKDRIKNLVAKRAGYKIIRFSEEMINKKPLEVKLCLQKLK